MEASNQNPKRHKQPTWYNNLKFYFTEYCANASIHGLKFIGEQGRYLVEKIWWTIFISVSLYFCATLILDTYRKWITAPVIVSFATSETPIWKIPFPAITVCPMIKSVKEKFDFANVLEKRAIHTEYDEQAAKAFSYMALVCPSTLQKFEDENATNTVDDDIITFFMEVIPSFKNTTHQCRWIKDDCTHEIYRYFTPMLTSSGVCYSLNILDRDELFSKEADLKYYDNFSIGHQPKSHWDLEKGYSPDANFETYPRRTVLSGPNGGLELVLYTDGKNIDYSCGDSLEGYKVLLHNPAQAPRSMQRYFWIPLNQIIAASIKPIMMTTSEELRSYLPKDRKCYFTGERVLRFFRVYNQQNCLLECATNNTYEECQCVEFHMPRDNATPICGPAMEQCASQVNIDFLTSEAIFQIKNSRKGQSKKKLPSRTRSDCGCLPSCHSLNYDVEISQLDWNWRQGKIGLEYDNETSHMSRIRIFFKDLQFMTSERSELYGQTEFWANCGGLLGLFTGFSFISLVEMLYFATLRLICNLRMFGRRFWSGANELLAKDDQ